MPFLVLFAFYLTSIFGGLYWCAKFGWNPYSSFDNNMEVLIFCAFGLKMPIHAPKITVLGI